MLTVGRNFKGRPEFSARPIPGSVLFYSQLPGPDHLRGGSYPGSNLSSHMKKILVLLLCVFSSVAFAQKFEGLALTPPMGWNTWNTFASNIN